MDTFVFAGGGSGGHLFPAIAVARELRKRQPDARIVFVSGSRAVEGDILGREAFERRQLEATTSPELKRDPVRSAWRAWRAWRTAAAWLAEWQPRAVIGCGGYVSVPVGFAARRAGIPLVLLEQNVVPGRATTWLSRWADAVCVSFDETAAKLPRGAKSVVTGNPVREEIAVLAGRPHARPPHRPTLLVLGGSQGAKSINSAMLDFAAAHRSALAGWRIVHQTGHRDREMTEARYAEFGIHAETSAFLVSIADVYAVADLVVSRAGATTLAELACAGLPAVLIPYPGAVRDHQARNAEAFATAGAALSAKDGSVQEMSAALLPLLNEEQRRREMAGRMARCARPSATQSVADVVLAARKRS
ncbi:MAG: undecaprenyldiphospho-muramoylpentapeptide beta-N-acetylglucosaminyltransferase [Planctomycetaceae bacterium]